MTSEILREERTCVYESMDAFLNDCQLSLMEDECKNNVILSICNRSRNQPIDMTKYQLLASFDHNGKILSCAVITPNKTFITIFISESDLAAKPLANYFQCHQMKLPGLAGPLAAIESFLKYYQRPIVQSKTLILNVLDKIETIHLVENSELSLATLKDLSLLTIWMKNFQIDVDLLPLKSDDEIQHLVKEKIDQKLFYTLMIRGNEKLLSTAVVARETEHFAFISWVYTPPELRGQGFATTTVHKLTTFILETKGKSCGLFTDAANPTSNKIYRRIGYQPLAQYLDIDFE